MKSYCWENKGKDENEKYEFINKYAEWIENPRQGNGPYSDPDAVENHNYEFYLEITKFLNNQKGNFFDREWDFIEPTVKKEKPSDRTITVKKDEKDYLYLTSDQFGFSADKKGIYDEKNHKLNEKYPFVKYVKNGGVKSLVGETIWYTRTIGGSFLWPKVGNGGKWMSPYNTKRGVKDYIEDRVDLTLYEIKEYLDYKNQGCQEPIGNLLYNAIKKASDLKKCKYCDNSHQVEGEELKKWLDIFASFKTYVDFFCFDDFVNKEDDEYYPKDIFTGKSITKENISEYRKEKFIQRKAEKEDLEKAFYNLSVWTISRTVRMEIVISNNDNKE